MNSISVCTPMYMFIVYSYIGSLHLYIIAFRVIGCIFVGWTVDVEVSVVFYFAEQPAVVCFHVVDACRLCHFQRAIWGPPDVLHIWHVYTNTVITAKSLNNRYPLYHFMMKTNFVWLNTQSHSRMHTNNTFCDNLFVWI